MTGNQYQELAMRTNDGKCTDRLEMAVFELGVEKGNDAGGILNACLGLSGEVGELNDMIKKSIFHGHEMDYEGLKKELGDCMWYIVMMCDSFGWKLEDIMRMNIEKLKKRYPGGFSEECSVNREEYQNKPKQVYARLIDNIDGNDSYSGMPMFASKMFKGKLKVMFVTEHGFYALENGRLYGKDALVITEE